MKGKFIVIEGIDGSGTTTQVDLLKKWLEEKNKETITTHEPLKKEGEIGKIIRERLIQDRQKYSPESIALAFAADRLVHVEDIILPALKKDKFVITDRYYYSSLVYQPSHGADFDWVKEINKYAMKPDLSIVLDVDVKEAMRRLKKRDSKSSIIFEKVDFQKKARKRYLQLSRKLKEGIRVVDGNGEEREIQSKIRNIVKENFPNF